MRRILVLSFFLCVTLLLNAQSLSVRFDNCTIEEAMEQLKNQGVSFILKSDSIDLNAKVNAEFKDAELKQILQVIFQNQNVVWEMRDMAVVVSAKKETAQQKKKEAVKTITKGRITDKQGEVIVGADIIIQGTQFGTVSGLNGEFSIPMEKEAILVISCLSYATEKIHALPGQELSIVMEDDTEYLDEVVVVGFGTQKKVNLTGAVATVSADAIVQRPVQNMGQALQGLVAGLNISQTSGLLDSEPLMNIRGIGTIGEGSSAAPLVLIDGTEGNLNTLNPQDVESI